MRYEMRSSSAVFEARQRGAACVAARPSGASEAMSVDWKEELRVRVRREAMAESDERSLAMVDALAWRSRLDAVKAQMADSSLRVAEAEAE
eukprot:3855845-Pleurochrysis_carterae.AAC.1